MRTQPNMALMPYPVGDKEGSQDDQQEFPLVHLGIPSPPESRLLKQFGMSAGPDKNYHSRLTRCFNLVDQQKIPTDMALPIPQPVPG